MPLRYHRYTQGAGNTIVSSAESLYWWHASTAYMSRVVADPVVPEFHYDPEHDTNENWSEMDFEDLQTTLARGGSIEDVAIFLCRRGTQDRVRKKADEMGWWPNTNALGAPTLAAE